MTSSTPGTPIFQDASGMTIREIVETYPETMAVLEPLGTDLCRGGAHPLGEALDLHGIEREPVFREIGRILADHQGEKV